MRHAAMLTLCLLTTAGVLPASAQVPFLPLSPGCAWTYTDGAGHELTIEAAGYAVVQGENTVELVWREPGDVFHNFWSLGPTGAVLLHGAYNEDGFVASYSPPIQWLPAVSATERCWSTTSRVYGSLDASQPLEEFTFSYCVVGGGILTVPAGEFDTVAVSDASPPLLTGADGGAACDLLGRRRDGAPRQQVPRSFSAGVGLVKEGDWELANYGGPTPFGTSSWSEVKALYSR